MENKININDLMIGNLVNYEQTTHIITEIIINDTYLLIKN